MKRIHVFFLLFCIFLIPALAYGADTMQLQIKTDDEAVSGTLEENAVTRQLLSLSPMSIEMKDYNGHERIGYPPERLSIKGAKKGWTPRKGDIALFAPWGNLCVYVKDSPFSGDLVYLGKIDTGLELLEAHKDAFQTRWLISAVTSKNTEKNNEQ